MAKKYDLESEELEAIHGTDVLPKSSLTDPVHAFCEALCWRAAINELFLIYGLIRRTPGEEAAIVRQVLRQRVSLFLDNRKAFGTSEDSEIKKMARCMIADTKRKNELNLPRSKKREKA